MVRRDSKVDNFAESLFFLLIIMMSGFLAGIRWSVGMLKSHRSLCESFSKTSAALCIYICLYGRIEISCTFPIGSPCRPSRVSPYTPSVLICCIRLLCHWSFRLCHRITYIDCFVAFDMILTLIWFVLMALSSADIRRDSVSLYYYYYYYYCTLLVFHNHFSWSSPEVFSVFWLILVLFQWSRLVLRFPILSITLPILYKLFWANQLNLTSLSFMFHKFMVNITNTTSEFFKPALTGGSSLKYERVPQALSKYSNWSQQRCSCDALDSPSDICLPLSLLSGL